MRKKMLLSTVAAVALSTFAGTAVALGGSGVKTTGAGADKTGTNCGDTVSVGPKHKGGV